MHWIYFLTIFLAVALAIVAGYMAFVDLKSRDQRRASKRAAALREHAPTPDNSPALFKSIGEFPLIDSSSASGLSGRFPTSHNSRWRSLVRRIQKSLDRGGLNWSVSFVLVSSVVASLGFGLTGWVLQGFLLGVPGFLLGAAGPLIYVEMRVRSRRARFLSQLPGAFELMARVIRSGQSVPQAFQAAADSLGDPIAAAFTRCREQQNMGLAPEAAFEELAEHSGILDMRIFVVAMLIQRNVGGNLSEVLERLAVLLRDRIRIRNQVQTLTAECRLQATILLILPFFMFVAIRFVNQAYSDEILKYPSLLVATLVSMSLGAAWIRRIINIDV